MMVVAVVFVLLALALAVGLLAKGIDERRERTLDELECIPIEDEAEPDSPPIDVEPRSTWGMW